VGSWVTTDNVPRNSGIVGTASMLLHLRCVESGVDLLVGGVSRVRLVPYAPEAGFPWNPYGIQLFEPGDRVDPGSFDYKRWYGEKVYRNGTSADTTGVTKRATKGREVAFIARSPQGRTDYRWQIYVLLGRTGIADGWAFTPPGKRASYLVRLRGAVVQDWADRMIAAATDPTLEAPARTRAKDAVSAAVPRDMRKEVDDLYQRFLDSRT
jgi:hypothetical protein